MQYNTLLKITYIGHATYLVSTSNTNILIDPVLHDGFGHNPDLNFKIWPPRTVDINTMPKIDAVILSHEHLDHFHIPSLASLPSNTIVYTGILTLDTVVEAIEKIGLTVKKIYPGTVTNIGDLEFQLFPAGSQTIFWEQRVNQILIRKSGFKSSDVFFTVDALVSEQFLGLIEQGELEYPRVVCVMNNSQTVPDKALGAYSNLLDTESTTSRGSLNGITVLNYLLYSQLANLSNTKEVIIGGNGYISPMSIYGPFLYSDHKKLANIANQLQHNFKVYGPRPGECLHMNQDAELTESSVSWIYQDIEYEQQKLQQQKEFLMLPQEMSIKPIQHPFSDQEAKDAVGELEQELSYIAQEVMKTDVGELAVKVHEYLSGKLNSKRILLYLLNGPDGLDLQYALCVTSLTFLPVSISLEEALVNYPFGLVCYFRDFIAITRGEQQIWDMAGIAMQAWYLGSEYATMITALYKLYSEQARPDLAQRIYDKAISKLQLNEDVKS